MTTPTDYPSGQPYSPPPWQTPPTPPEPKRRNWFARHKVLTGVGVLFALGVVGGVAGGNSADPKAPVALPSASVAPAPPASLPAEQSAANSKAANTPAPKPAAPALTKGQQNAVGSAKDYLAMSGFSRTGLIKQLSSAYGDGYSKADATFAVDYLHPNWKAQAVRSAKDYLALQHFSRAGLIEQLSSPYGDQYTKAEARYAADQVGL